MNTTKSLIKLFIVLLYISLAMFIDYVAIFDSSNWFNWTPAWIIGLPWSYIIDATYYIFIDIYLPVSFEGPFAILAQLINLITLCFIFWRKNIINHFKNKNL